MYLIINGIVASGHYSGGGKLVITKHSIFVFKESENIRKGAIFLGVLGMIIGNFLDRRTGQESPPAFLDDPDLLVLKEKERRQLLGEELLIKYECCNPAFTIEPVTMGIRFNDGSTGAKYSGVYKNKILRFLESNRART